MNIENNILVKVFDQDINPDGTFTFPEGVTSIGDSAFENCTSLKKIEIPKGVISIGYYAFYNCVSLKKVAILEIATTIGVCVFYNCNALTDISMGNIDIKKLYEASEQTINGVKLKLYSTSEAASFATMSEFLITDGKNHFECNYKKNTFFIENATLEAKKYVQKILMPLLLQIQSKRNLI